MKRKFESLYNNSKHSDIKITFEKTGESIFAHKIVLMSSSKCNFTISNPKKDFEDLIESGKIENNEILLPKNEDENVLKEMIKFFYTGAIDYSDDSQLVMFIITSNKVNKQLTKQTVQSKRH
jgi:hypothetical protein